MADYFSSNPNFVNPSYATPEQLANERSYAAELMKQSGQEVKHPAGALANALLALSGGLERNRANELQSQAAAVNGQSMSELISQLQNGQKINPQNLGRMVANPMVSPEQRALAIELMRPKGVEDVMGRPGYASPVQGVQAAPVQGNFQPGFRAPEVAGSVSTTTPMPAPMAPQRPPKLDAVSPQGGVFGGMNSSPVGWNTPPATTAAPGGVQAPGAVPPAAPAPASPTFNERFAPASRLDALAAKDRELTAAKSLTQGGADANSNVIKADIASANDAPNILKGVGVIKDNIQRFGDNITFGPTSAWALEMKRAAANYAPGFMKDQLNSVAAADSINKVGIGLAGTLAGQLQGGSNADTFAKAMQGVPGLTTSKEGALAMADMIQQAALKSQELGKLLRDPANFSRYAELKANFFRDHPVINPLTGNPIEMDVEAVRKNGDGTGSAPSGFKVLKVH